MATAKIALVLGLWALGSPAWASLPNTTVEDLIQEGRSAGQAEIDRGRYPEVARRAEFASYSAAFAALYNRLLGDYRPIRSRDLPNMYQSTVRTQAGFYQVTRTEPVLDQEVIK
ncbi:MAG: hypothetical protein Q6K99_03420 [Thermostichales cyanobacterium BF4_bins_65]